MQGGVSSQEFQKVPEARKGEEADFFLEPLEEMQLCWCVLNFWPSELCENTFASSEATKSVAFSP